MMRRILPLAIAVVGVIVTISSLVGQTEAQQPTRNCPYDIVIGKTSLRCSCDAVLVVLNCRPWSLGKSKSRIVSLVLN